MLSGLILIGYQNLPHNLFQNVHVPKARGYYYGYLGQNVGEKYEIKKFRKILNRVEEKHKHYFLYGFGKFKSLEDVKKLSETNENYVKYVYEGFGHQMGAVDIEKVSKKSIIDKLAQLDKKYRPYFLEDFLVIYLPEIKKTL